MDYQNSGRLELEDVVRISLDEFGASSICDLRRLPLKTSLNVVAYLCRELSDAGIRELSQRFGMTTSQFVFCARKGRMLVSTLEQFKAKADKVEKRLAFVQERIYPVKEKLNRIVRDLQNLFS